MKKNSQQRPQFLTAEEDVRKEFGNQSKTTWWRHKRDGRVPPPDYVINGKNFYSIEARERVLQAIAAFRVDPQENDKIPSKRSVGGDKQ